MSASTSPPRAAVFSTRAMPFSTEIEPSSRPTAVRGIANPITAPPVTVPSSSERVSAPRATSTGSNAGRSAFMRSLPLALTPAISRNGNAARSTSEASSRNDDTPGWRGSLLRATWPRAVPPYPWTEKPNDVRRRSIAKRSGLTTARSNRSSGQGADPAGRIRTRTSRARTEARPPAPTLPRVSSAPARCASISIRRARTS